jgi:ech hydrogenase subunit D
MMKEDQPTLVVSAVDLMLHVKRFFDQNARMIQIGCTQDGEVFELNYSFDVSGAFQNIRVLTDGNEAIPSVSAIYLCAFIYENEIHDLYGITFEGIAVDYKGTLIKTAKLHPFRMDPAEMKAKPKAKVAAKPPKEEESPAEESREIVEDSEVIEAAESSKEEEK